MARRVKILEVVGRSFASRGKCRSAETCTPSRKLNLKHWAHVGCAMLGTRARRGSRGWLSSVVIEVGVVKVRMELLRSDQLGECQDALLPGRDARAPQPSCRCTDEMAVQGMIDAGDWRTEA